MDPERRRRVLIRTLPLSNGNYGGILQAYALQQVLLDLGLNPATDLTISKPVSAVGAKATRLVVRALPSWLFTSRTGSEIQDSVIRDEISQPLATFVDEKIVGVNLYRRPHTIDREVVQRFGNLVVGSDQVWRHQYGDVKSYLFDFVQDPEVRLVSFAASFGHDGLQGYNRQLRDTTRQLAQRLHYVSVRELSAIELCSKHWGITAVHHVDPTMLLSRAHYEKLACEEEAVSLSPQCVSYVLDESPPIRSVIDQTCAYLGVSETRLAPKPKTYAALRRYPGRYTQPTVQTWLRAFSEAQFVITDSFHGTIFAILNNKPFLTICNTDRGASRFESLLGLLGLSRRLISPGSVRDVRRILDQAIDWELVELQLATKREEAIDYLSKALLTDDPLPQSTQVT